MIQVLVNIQPDDMQFITKQMHALNIQSLDDYLVYLIDQAEEVKPKKKMSKAETLFGPAPIVAEKKPSPLLQQFLTAVVSRIQRIPRIPLALGDVIAILDSSTMFGVEYSKTERIKLGQELSDFIRHNKQPDPRLTIRLSTPSSKNPARYFIYATDEQASTCAM